MRRTGQALIDVVVELTHVAARRLVPIGRAPILPVGPPFCPSWEELAAVPLPLLDRLHDDKLEELAASVRSAFVDDSEEQLVGAGGLLVFLAILAARRLAGGEGIRVSCAQLARDNEQRTWARGAEIVVIRQSPPGPLELVRVVAAGPLGTRRWELRLADDAVVTLSELTAD